ncbi:hypothetical protein CYY_010042, partial [Polysphondylium violaceum]
MGFERLFNLFVVFLLLSEYLYTVSSLAPTLDKVSPSFGFEYASLVSVTGSNFGTDTPTCWVSGAPVVTQAYSENTKTFAITAPGSNNGQLKQYQISCDNPEGEKSNSLPFGIIKMPSLIQENNYMYMVGEWDGIPNIGLVKATPRDSSTILEPIISLNVTHMRFNLIADIAKSVNRFGLYDGATSTYQSFYIFNFAPVVTTSTFSPTQFSVTGYVYTATTTIEMGPSNTACVINTQTETTLTCTPPYDPTLMTGENIQYSVKYGNGAITSLIYNFDVVLTGYHSNLPDGVTSQVGIPNFASQSRLLYGLTATPFSQIDSETTTSILTFQYPLDAKCGYFFIGTSTQRLSNSLLMCPTPKITSIVTKPDAENDRLLSFKGNFLAQHYYATTVQALTFSLSYGDGKSTSCQGLVVNWNPADLTYTVSCNVMFLYSFKILAQTVTGESHSVLVGYNPTITSCSSTNYLVPGQVIITGTGFANFNLQVQIGGKTCANPFALSGAERIVCEFSSDVIVNNFKAPLEVSVVIESIYSASNDIFLYNQPLPVVNSASSSIYLQAGLITIFGKYMYTTQPITVNIGGIGCTSPTVNSLGTQVTCYFPSTAPPGNFKNPLDVYVSFETVFTTTAAVFKYDRPVPEITSASSTTYGTPGIVTIQGLYFFTKDPITVLIAGVQCTSAVVNVHWDQITCNFPSTASPGTYTNPLNVFVGFESVFSVNKAVFSYIRPNPVISGSSSLNYGTPGTVTIIGKYFLPTTTISVSIGSKECPTQQVLDTEIICFFSADETVSDFDNPLTVSVLINSIYTSSNDVFFYNRLTPTITSASTLVYNKAGIVTLKGTNFAIDVLIVTIGDKECGNPSLEGTIEIYCLFEANVPTDDYFLDPLVVLVSVRSTVGTSPVFYYTRPDPLITSSSSLFFKQPGTITIYGDYLAYNGLGDYIITVGGSTCSSAVIVSTNEITCDYLANVKIPDYDTPLEVIIAIESQYIGQGSVFYYEKPNPSIISASSTTYNTAGKVTVMGSQFVQDNLFVTIGQVECTTPLVSEGATKIVCDFPSNTPTASDFKSPLEVFVSIKSIYTTKNSVFYYNQPNPIIHSSSSLFFKQPGRITINGDNFFTLANGEQITIGGSSCTSVIIVSVNQITCDYQANIAVSDYNTPLEISVSIEAGIGQGSVFYYKKPDPSIISASSTTYNTAGKVTIIGTQFVQDNLFVTIGQVECTTPLISEGATKIICDFPSNAPTASDFKSPLEVFVSIKSTYTTKNSVFYYTRPNPVIISSTSALYGIPSTITITGSYFNSKDILVKVGGSQCTDPISSQDGTSITCLFQSNVVVNDLATALQISLVIESKYSDSKALFYYTRGNPSITSCTSTKYGVPGKVTIVGNQFARSFTVQIGGSNCLNPTYINQQTVTCNFNSDVSVSNYREPLQVFMSILNTLNISNDVFLYVNPDKTCPIGIGDVVCSGYGTCNQQL